MKIPAIDDKGIITPGQPVNPAVFGIEGKEKLVVQAIRVFLANQRRARAKTKSRAEVTGSTAKIWRQKGTGRARHGARKAPIFVGGGVAHGPSGEQNYKLRLNKKMVRLAINQVLSEKLKKKKLFLVDKMQFKKTHEAFSFIKKLREKLKIKRTIGFMIDGEEESRRCFANIENVFVIKTESLNPYWLLRGEYLFLTKEALKNLNGELVKNES